MNIEGGLRIMSDFKKKSEPDKPLVSIVTVCLNGERYIEDAITSVLKQTYDNIEYIVVDGGSRDMTIEILKKYEDNIDYWISEPDRGIYDALNKGIAAANGEWVGAIHSDDWYHPRAVDYIVDSYRKNPEADVIYGDLLYVRQEGAYLTEEDCDVDGKYMTRIGTHENMLEKWKLYHPTCFVKKSNYLQYRFDPNLKLSGDYDLMLSFYQANKNFLYTKNPIAYFRPVGTTERTQYLSVLENFRIRKKYSYVKALKRWFLEVTGYLKEHTYAVKYQLRSKFKNG